jgi:hypothetical protein
MPTILKLSDLDGRGVLAFDLRHLLPLVEGVASDLVWRVLPAAETTWLLGTASAVIPVQQFSIRVDDSKDGVDLSWIELQDLAESIHQTVCCTFIAARLGTALPDLANMFLDEWRYVDRAAVSFYEAIEIAFQAVDSSFWLVYIRKGDLRERIREAFEDVESIDRDCE